MQREILLASTSPRRRELITRLKLPIRSIAVEVDETPRAGEAPDDMVCRLAQDKVESALQAYPHALIIAADTTVGLGDLVLGKPEGAADAVRMLKLLRGRSHRVYSGVAVAGKERQVLQIAETVVWMRDYTDEEIQAYVATGDPLDKAAAYAIQHPSFHPVERIEGCYSNVMGLPLCRVYLELREFGITVDPTETQTVFSSILESDCPTAKGILATQS